MMRHREVLVSKPRNLKDKKTSVESAVKEFLKNGITLGLGGFVNTRVPIGIVHDMTVQFSKIYKILKNPLTAWRVIYDKLEILEKLNYYPVTDDML